MIVPETPSPEPARGEQRKSPHKLDMHPEPCCQSGQTTSGASVTDVPQQSAACSRYPAARSFATAGLLVQEI